MAEIMEVFEDIKETVGDKTFYILGAGALLFGLYNLSKGSGAENSESLVPVTITGSYPDSVTNADVIIGTLQDSIEYSEGVITEKLEGIKEEQDALNESVDTGFKDMSDKLVANKNLFDTAFDNIQGSITDMNKDITSINGQLTSISKEQASIKNSVNTINNAVKKSTNSTSSTKKTSSGSTKKTTTNTSTKKTTINTSTKKASASATYTYKTKAGLNTSTSIVDALKASGVNSSFDNRKKIAEANGITNYTGSYSQNVQLLSKLKTGKLKKV